MDAHPKYRLTYNIQSHPEPVAKDAIPPGHGAADAIVVISILDCPDGGASYAFASGDGQGPLPPGRIFQSWAMLACHLAETLPREDARKDLCDSVHAVVRKAILSRRAEADTPPNSTTPTDAPDAPFPWDAALEDEEAAMTRLSGAALVYARTTEPQPGDEWAHDRRAMQAHAKQELHAAAQHYYEVALRSQRATQAPAPKSDG